jgi:hypothetical protein
MNVLWFLLGVILGVFNAWLRRWSVSHMHPGAPRRAVTWAIGGAALRWVLIAGLLSAALQQGLAAGLLACAGLLLTCWGWVSWWHWRRAPG